MSGRRGKVRNAITLFAVVLLYLSDQLTKFLAIKYLSPDESVPVINKILHLTLVYNTGAAFGMFRSKPHLFVVIAIFAVFFINFLLLRKSHVLNTAEKFSLCLILAGTLGNLTDRLRFGYVIDFIDLRIWPVFNFADSFITIGAVILGLSV
ncbi:MAG: signal peptidase II, partial [Candidatus Omnitrophota bacterium]